MFNVNITKLAPMRIIGLPHTGPYGEINRTFTELYQLVTSRQLFVPAYWVLLFITTILT